MKAARANARQRLKEIGRERERAMLEAFRQEVGTTVRSISPLLLSFVATQGGSLDEILDQIGMPLRWPGSPSLARSGNVKFRPVRDVYRHYLVSTATGWHKAYRMRGAGPGTTFMHSGDDWARLEIVAHSLEFEALIGSVKFETLFGELRVELDDRLPDTLAMACVGRLIGDVVDHAALRGRDWPITRVEDSHPLLGQTLVVATGSIVFRMPWVR
ncbi:MAG: hypothetical protein EOP58_01070 [Sphingomonadales bacterium]|nr:MAG: hypothetical protein EOP58_01070 [Sphingomonadales bacterium]